MLRSLVGSEMCIRDRVVATAGSINPGSRLSGLRAAMSMIQQYGRYQPLQG